MSKAKSLTEKQVEDRIKRIKSYEDACRENKERVVLAEEFANIPRGEVSFAFHKVTTVFEALGQGEVLDYNEFGQEKWSAWFNMDDKKGDAAGSGFSLFGVYYGHTFSYVGARLSLGDQKLVRHAVEICFNEFKLIYKK